MSEIISIPFEFFESRYTALVNIKQQSSVRSFIISIMDVELEKLLFGNHVFYEAKGVILPNYILTGSTSAAKLQQAVVSALNNHFYPLVTQ